MKTLFTTLLVFLAFISLTKAQSLQELPIDLETNRVALAGTKEIDATKDELYNRTKAWGVAYFNSIKSVLQVDNREGGQVIGKGIMTIHVPKDITGNIGFDYPIHFTFKVEMKDGRYRYRFDDLRTRFSASSETTPAEDYLFGDLSQYNYGGKKAQQKLEDSRVYVKKELLKSLLALEASLNEGLSSAGDDW